ncbi:conserved hypothetical protein [Mesorhizobium metallidurans STM 2683]|uniref:Transmembrane protein n=1 Tax=Mesorhizobium metallidurans STM 2683 TaxID=1297569 RepID=M5EJ02_9HYPH|nr:conserved hypothetical protein [Mesorhizobium metallidurans STM 2683]
METVSRIYDSRSEAASAVRTLLLTGVPRENITVFWPPNDDLGVVSAIPAVGAAFGASAGLLAAMSLAVYGGVPLGAGWMATAVFGGVACGAFAGWLLGTFANAPKELVGKSPPQGVVLVVAEVEEQIVAKCRVSLGLAKPQAAYLPQSAFP